MKKRRGGRRWPTRIALVFVFFLAFFYNGRKKIIVLSAQSVPEAEQEETILVGYVEFLGDYLYFDGNGLVVESSQELYEDVPQVSGLDLDYVILGEVLPLEDSSVFSALLQFSQFCVDETISWNQEEVMIGSLVDRIHLDSDGDLFCYLGDIVVSLGNGENLDGKLLEMKDILPELYGRKGTLILDDYDATLSSPSYIFQSHLSS